MNADRIANAMSLMRHLPESVHQGLTGGNTSLMQHVTKGDAQAPSHDATLTALTLNPRRSKIEDVPEQDHEYDPGITVKDSTNLVAVEHLGSLLHLW